ncbi:MAG TPA: hypothetical protein DCZ95_02035 [Verrucomicrobia bacterium]|nr:MAG: hypothetical protein A2X46_00815 [Lentisphaerae bacterium GWF2_57_35]HBA82850.1 hypothetical protein [Verrucomicrobiota bacterium]
MSKVYDNLRKPDSEPSITRRTKDVSSEDGLDLFSFAAARKAREAKDSRTPGPEKIPVAAAPQPIATPRRENVSFDQEPIERPPEPLTRPLRSPASSFRKPSLNIFSDEAASAGMEQDAVHPFFVSRWIWGAVAVIIVLLLPFLIFKKRDADTAVPDELLSSSIRQESVEEQPPAKPDVEEPVRVTETKPTPIPPPQPIVTATRPSQAPQPTTAQTETIAGASIRKNGRELTIVFKDGLFSTGNNLTPQARELLARAAQWMATHAAGHTIHVIGCTDNETVRPNSEYKSNRELGLRRAQAVEKVLAGRNELKTFQIDSSSRGDKDAPYPNDTKQNRRKNRTVLLRLAPQ